MRKREAAEPRRLKEVGFFEVTEAGESVMMDRKRF